MKRKRREAGHQAGVSRSGWAGVGWGGRCGLPPSLPWPRFWLLLPLLYPDRSSLTTRGRRNYLDFLTRAGLPCAFSYSFTRFCSRLWLSLSLSFSPIHQPQCKMALVYRHRLALFCEERVCGLFVTHKLFLPVHHDIHTFIFIQYILYSSFFNSSVSLSSLQ